MSARDQDLLKILRIAKETSFRGRGISLDAALRETNYRKLRPGFAPQDLLPLVLSNPEFVSEWIAYSEDKRTSGGWYLLKESEIGQVGREDSREWFHSIEEAVSVYVVRELDVAAGYVSG
ncbi:MAG: hypothetical protein R3245_05465 [Kiloniellales bacterium]|nr:hypothetical protein [Kiloniellales bacterium]